MRSILKKLRLISLLKLVCPIACILSTGCAARLSQAELERKAKITPEQGQQIALRKVPHGFVQYSTLQKKNGGLVWLFEITTGLDELTNVEVDAMNGQVLAVEQTPTSSTTERQAERY